VARANPRLHAILHLGPLEPLAKRLGLVAHVGLDLRVLGSRHVPPKGPLVVAAAHPSIVDMPVVDAAVRRPTEVVLDERFLALPIASTLLEIRGVHALRRTPLGFDERNVETLARAAASARAGHALLIFPSGWEHNVGSGVARLGAASAAPVLPVASYHVGGDRARPRTLVAVRRPLPPPADDPVARRRFVQRLRRQHRRLGLTLPEGEGVREACSMALDDARLWRRPPDVVRRCARFARLEGAPLARCLRAARALRRGCARLRCSVGDLRSPPGLRHVLAYVALLPLAGVGAILCAPALVALRLAFARRSIGGRAGRLHVGLALAPWYGLALAASGFALAGPPGLLVPIAALAGLCALGLARPLQRRVRCLFLVRRHGRRLARLLAAFDACVYADRVSAPLRARVA